MAPSEYPQGHPFAITRVYNYGYTYANSCYNDPRYAPRKKETKQEKIKRIAIERMYASRKTYNQRTTSQIEIKQLCKPRHLNILKFSHLKK